MTQSTLSAEARERVHDAIRRAIFKAEACNMMIESVIADALYDRCRKGTASVPAYGKASWNAISATDAAIDAVLKELERA